MVQKRRRVFLTGATGNWGRFVLDEFRDRADRFEVIALVLPTPADSGVIRRYEDMQNLQVRFGDLIDYAAVESCVAGADFVLHLGGIVHPPAMISRDWRTGSTSPACATSCAQ